jgi:pyruvate dehydrogenase E1 component alpha subunit
VFVCENNEYSMGTPLSRRCSVEDTSLKALGYGMERDRFFADDVLEVKAHRRRR